MREKLKSLLDFSPYSNPLPQGKNKILEMKVPSKDVYQKYGLSKHTFIPPLPPTKFRPRKCMGGTPVSYRLPIYVYLY